MSAPMGLEPDDEHLFDAEYPDDDDPGPEPEPLCDTCGDPASYQHPDGRPLCSFCAGFCREEYGVKCIPLIDAHGCGG